MQVKTAALSYGIKYYIIFIFRYMDIESVAASELYSLLMKDVRAVCIQKMEPEIEDSSIDLEMLRLAYLLSKLDKDWAGHIAPR